MVALRRSRFPRRRALTAGCALAALALAGCGGGEEFANERPPPLPVTVAALVDQRSVSVSPAQFGGGMVRIVIANQSGERQTVALRAQGEDQALPTRTTDPIAVGATGELKLDLEPGTYRLGTAGKDIRAGVLEVGPQRPAGGNELLLP